MKPEAVGVASPSGSTADVADLAFAAVMAHAGGRPRPAHSHRLDNRITNTELVICTVETQATIVRRFGPPRQAR